MIQFDEYFSNGLKPPTSGYLFKKFWSTNKPPPKLSNKKKVLETLVKKTPKGSKNDGNLCKNGFAPGTILKGGDSPNLPLRFSQSSPNGNP